jgi:hypothetical protein
MHIQASSLDNAKATDDNNVKQFHKPSSNSGMQSQLKSRPKSHSYFMRKIHTKSSYSYF